MKILLINNNPVVSRLTALSARKEDVEIDEIQEVTELTSYDYDIVFVDADSWNEDVKSTIFTHIDTERRVLFYAQDDDKDLDIFDKGILKPFLPSEVSAVIRSVEEIKTLNDISSEIEEEKSSELVDELKEEKIDEPTLELFSKETPELEVADNKTDLMEELTKIDKEKVEDDILSSSAFEDDLFKETPAELNINADDFASKDDKDTKGDLFDLDLNDDEIFSKEVKNSTEDKVLENDLLEFDLEKDNELHVDNEEAPKEELIKEEVSEEINDLKKDVEIESKPEIETKVLDVEEIEAIKGILEDDTSDTTMTLEDLVAPTMAAGVAAVALSSDEVIASEDNEDLDKKKKKKSKKEKKNILEDTDTSNTLVDTLSNLKVESLRELLAGATVSIKIEFPKA